MELISTGYSLQDISTSLGISQHQLNKYLRELQMKGFIFDKKYYSTGDILYHPSYELSKSSTNKTPIYTSPDTDELTLIALSDLHFGNKMENPRSLEIVYNYCINNNIHLIINAGDMLDALSFGYNGLKKYDNYFDLFEKSLRKYPHDNSILNFFLLGNHDIDSLLQSGQHLENYLKNYRPDIVPIGIGEGELDIKNSRILVKHPLKISSEPHHKDIQNYSFVLRGHRHQTCLIDSGTPQIFVPSLSDLKFHGNFLPPEALQITVKFNNGHIFAINIIQLIIKGKVYPVNNLHIDLKEGKHPIDNHVSYEETYKKRILKP